MHEMEESLLHSRPPPTPAIQYIFLLANSRNRVQLTHVWLTASAELPGRRILWSRQRLRPVVEASRIITGILMRHPTMARIPTLFPPPLSPGRCFIFPRTPLKRSTAAELTTQRAPL